MSTKATSTQPGRRTPLSLSGAVSKGNPNKSGNSASNSGSGGSSANSHSSSSTNKPDNKLQQQKNEIQNVNNPDAKENLSKKQQSPFDKKQQQNDKKSNERIQNGVNSNKQLAPNENKQQQQQLSNENKQQSKERQQQQQQSNENKQQSKDRQQQQQNGKDDNKSTEKEKDTSDKLDKQQDKSEKVDPKLKESKKADVEKSENKKEEKKSKEVKDNKEDKKEAVSKSDLKPELQNQTKKDDQISKVTNENKNKEHDQIKVQDKIENMEVIKEQQLPQMPSPPVTPKNSGKGNKTLISTNKTPTKFGEKTPQKPSSNNSAPTVIKRETTTTVDDNDVEMEPLTVEGSPTKPSQSSEPVNIKLTPSATSTPGKIILTTRISSGSPKSDVQLAMQTGLSPERPKVFSQISGRKSIRPLSDYTPSKFQSNLQFRESYRRINTDLDATNTSMNVTVGSEVPSNLSFSFFGRGRKRDHTPPPQNLQSAIGDVEISPPKRARLDMQGFFSVVASPLSLLRNRFSKASLKSSTPVKLQDQLNAAEDEIEVQNVSGVSLHEEMSKSNNGPAETNTKVNENDITIGEELNEDELKPDTEHHATIENGSEGKQLNSDVSFTSENSCGIEQACEQPAAVGDPLAKNKRCIVM